jgi:hypothetical protein
VEEATQFEVKFPGHGTFVFGATPTFQADYEDFTAKWSKSKLVAHAREFAQRALIEPAGQAGVDKLVAAFAKYPAAPMTIVGELEKLAGSEIEVSVRKK